MALTAQEKNQIAQGVDIALGLRAGEFFRGSMKRSDLATGLSFAFGTQVGDFVDLVNRPRAPKSPPLGLTLGAVLRLNKRGLEGRLSSDPFRLATVISTADQADVLDELVLNAALRREADRQDFSSIFDIRQGVIEGLAETAVERGFARTIDPELRGGVFRETADAPLQFVEGDFLP